ncbi:MAG: hypothetical protein BWK79_19305 [Beggiatoa sp. IS2]|nr:MAG: hypothetical protein BWK79_19305 [Beggiatoa sp. IS2]
MTTPTDGGTVTTTPVPGNGNGGGNQPTTEKGGKDKATVERQLYFYHSDHLGSTGYVTDENGEVFQHLEYFPFGETWVEEASNTQRTPFGFTGKELDE